METIVITNEELDSLKLLQSTYQQTIQQLGLITLDLETLNLKKQEILNSITKIKEEESILGNSLQTKYGEGQINMENGVFTPPSVIPQ